MSDGSQTFALHVGHSFTDLAFCNENGEICKLQVLLPVFQDGFKLIPTTTGIIPIQTVRLKSQEEGEVVISEETGMGVKAEDALQNGDGVEYCSVEQRILEYPDIGLLEYSSCTEMSNLQNMKSTGAVEPIYAPPELILEGVDTDQEDNLQTFQEESMDYEKVSAAATLLEFHNQHVLTLGADEPVEQSSNCDEYQQEDVKRFPTEAEEEKTKVVFPSRPRPYDSRKYIRRPYPSERKPPISPIKLTKVQKEKDQEGETAKSYKLYKPTTLVKYLILSHPLKKKRGLTTDTRKVIPNSEYKKQLQDSSDIVKKLDLAPRTKSAMTRVGWSGIGKFFAYSGRKTLSLPLTQLFYTRLTTIGEFPSTNSLRDEVQPLDPNLKTPVASLTPTTFSIAPLENTLQVSHEYLDSAMKRTAESFDSLVKGMNFMRRSLRGKVPRAVFVRKSEKNI